MTRSLFLTLGLAVQLVRAQAPSGAEPSTIAFRVDISGGAGQRIMLKTVDLPGGYIATFCTLRVCAPFQVSFRLPVWGRDRIEMQLIKTLATAPRPRSIGVSVNGSVHARIAIAPPNR